VAGEEFHGLPAHFYATVPPLNADIKPLDAVERFFASTKASIQHGGNGAFYSPSRDIVQMPDLQTFRDGESFYAVLAHEMTHNADTRIMLRRTSRVPESGAFRRGSSA